MAAKILIVDDEPYLTRLMEYALKAEGYQLITAVSGSDAIKKVEVEHPDLVILDVMLPDLSGIEVTQHLRNKPETVNLPIIMLSALGQVNDKIEGLKAGADEYITKPVDLREMTVRVAALLARRAQITPKAIITRGKLITVCGPKGGVGRTFVAVNLAIELSKLSGRRVVLVDGSSQWGGIDLALNLRPSRGMFDLLARADKLDMELIDTVMSEHNSGIRVLVAPTKLDEGAPTATSSNARRVIAALQEVFDYVVADTQTLVDDYTETFVNLSDILVPVITAELAAFRNTKQLLDYTASNGHQLDKVNVVLNRFDPGDDIQPQDIEKVLGFKIAVKIPSNAQLASYSLNRGVPIVVSHPRHTVSRAFNQLAEVITAKEELKGVVVQPSKLGPTPGGLFGRR